MKNLRITHRSGIALVLVVAVLAIAAIMSYAMLSSASLQAQVSGSASRTSTADTLSESGVNYALYYLEHPEIAPSLTNGYFPGQTGVSLGSSVDGTFDVAVSDKAQNGSNLPAKTYLVTSTGKSGSLNRTIRAKVYTNTRYKVVSALSANADMIIPPTVTLSILDDTTAGFTRSSSDPLVRSDGRFILASLTSVVGAVAATTTNATSTMSVPKYPTIAAPTLTGASEINTLKSYTTYTYHGNTYSADRLTWDPSNETLTTANATANPMNVWYTTRTTNMQGVCTINGTLIVATGKTLKISGTTTITAKPDPSTGNPALPGLVVDKDVSFEGLNRTLTVNGLTWVSNQILANAITGVNWKLNVNGALMLPGTPTIVGSQISSVLNGTVNLKYVQAKVDLPTLCDTDQIPQSIQILTWTN